MMYNGNPVSAGIATGPAYLYTPFKPVVEKKEIDEAQVPQALAQYEDVKGKARAELDASRRQNLCVPVLGTLEDSLWPGRYLYGTDNHRSTEGVVIRTRQVLAWLAEYLPPGSVQTG